MLTFAVQAQITTLTEATKALYSGEPTRAATITLTYLKTHPNDANARVILARAVLAQGQFQPAYNELKKALTIDPNHIDALYYLGIIATALSQNEYKQLYSLAPDSDRVHQLLAESFKAQDNPTEAESEYLAALKANPNSVEVLTALGEFKREQSKFDEAIDFYLRAEKSGGMNYDLAYGLGASYTFKQDYAKAQEYLKQAIKYDVSSSAAHFALGNVLFQMEQMTAAVPSLKQAISLEPKLRQAYFLLGRSHQKLGNKLEAQAAFKKVDELSQAELEEMKRVQKPK